jgi:predicted dithiol-disulfide oxidoreductase (DUF899 family)
VSLPEIVSREEWTAARRRLLEREKEHTRAGDALAAERRRLPMVRVHEDYVFDSPAGEHSLLDLFDGRAQLVIYHAMWLDDRDRLCPGCTGFLDQVAGLDYLGERDTTFAAVTRVAVDKLEAWKSSRGWEFPWYSVARSRFNYDYHASFDDTVAPFEYNYRTQEEIEALGMPVSEWEQPYDLHALSVFLADGGQVFHTYSAYARGADRLLPESTFLDLTPLGRQEEWEEPKGRAAALKSSNPADTLN